MKKWREASVRRRIREGVYFKVLGKMIDLAQREMADPARKKRGEKILTGLRNDLDYLQTHYRIIKRNKNL